MAPTYLSPGVYVEEVDKGSKPIEGAGTAVAAFIGFAQKGLANTPVLITNWTQFVENFGEFIEGSYLAHSVYGYFNNGGGRCYVVRLGAQEDGAGEQGSAARAALPANAEAAIDSMVISALPPGEDASDISVEITEAQSVGDGEEPGPELFNLIVRRGSQEVETYENLTLRRGRNVRYAETEVNERSQVIRLNLAEGSSSLPLAERRPRAGTYNLVPPASTTMQALEVVPRDFEGNAADRTGIGGLEVADDVTMLCAPDLMAAHEAGIIDLAGVQAVQLAMMNHCERMGDRVAIIDCPPGLKPQEVQDWRVNQANYDSKYAALYYPWIKVFDPLSGRNMAVPPSGHMAGIWARSDATRGVHKAPANEVIAGAVDVETQITKGEQDGLNPVGVNCIRAFPGRGIRVWGARTLSSDPAWRYLNVRRLFNFVEKSIEAGTQWVVFEPNDFDLWQRIKRDVSAFLTLTWRDGALFGRTPAEAFYVKCDDETNPTEAIDAGQVMIEIGIAPVKPAEFVIFRISQMPGAGGVSE